jgi:hypothetical protein
MPIHRRALLRRIGVGSALAGVTAGLGWSAASAAPARAPALEPSAGSWKTWLLASGDQFRAPPPPGAAASWVELRRLGDLVAQRDANALDQIAYWDAGAPGYRWNEIAIDQAIKATFSGARGARMMALLNTAIHDATVAAWDSKQAYERPTVIIRRGRGVASR